MADKLTWKGGDAASGWEVRIDNARRVLRFIVWGYWTPPTAVAYRDAAMVAMRQLSAGGPWSVLADISRYPPQKPEVQKCHGELMAAAGPLGMAKAANLVDNSLTQMQIRRLSTESGLPEFAFFQDEAAALSWLEKA